MGTRSTVAVPEGDGWRGRYVHWDGYPTHMAKQLWDIVQRDGLDTARRVLTADHYGWASIDATQGGDHSGDVAGYGTSYSDEPEDSWYTQGNVAGAGPEWAYVLTDGGLLVLKIPVNNDGAVTLIGLYRWDEVEPDWGAVETAGYEPYATSA